mgnify:CR=1 FL=1
MSSLLSIMWLNSALEYVVAMLSNFGYEQPLITDEILTGTIFSCNIKVLCSPLFKFISHLPVSSQLTIEFGMSYPKLCCTTFTGTGYLCNFEQRACQRLNRLVKYNNFTGIKPDSPVLRSKDIAISLCGHFVLLILIETIMIY